MKPKIEHVDPQVFDFPLSISEAENLMEYESDEEAAGHGVKKGEFYFNSTEKRVVEYDPWIRFSVRMGIVMDETLDELEKIIYEQQEKDSRTPG